MGGQTAPEGGGGPDSAASGGVRADTWAATSGSTALRRSGSVPDLHGSGLYESLMSIPPLPREGAGLGAGPGGRPAPSAPDLYNLELECRRAQQERAQLPALARRQFLSG